MKTKKAKKTAHRLMVGLMLCTILFTTSRQTAHAELEDWRTTFGLVEKYGNEEDGYFIYGKGDIDSSCLDYEKPFDLMSSEIRFKFEAHPFNEYYKVTWAYLAIYPVTDDNKWLYHYEDNQREGRIEFLLEQHPDGSMKFCLYQHPISRVLISIPDFDYEAVHTISIEEKLMGTYVVLDGMPLAEVDLTQEVQKHIGENAGHSYLRVGGLQQFAFEHLKIQEKETTETAPTQTDVDNSSETKKTVKKLGSLAGEDTEEEKDTKSETSVIWLWLIPPIMVVLAVVVITVVLLKRKRKGKEEKE